MNRLAINGGAPVRQKPFALRKTVGEREIKAVNEVLQKGDISLFFGSAGDFFLGGPYVKEFERKWASKYGFKHCISTNSWTTGLMAAVGAVGVGPGDEVICTPYTMSASATSILFYGGIPVFVDIEDETFNIDPKKIEEKITPRTKAIMLAHIFGHPADMDPILQIARKHGLKVIEDGAQSPGAKYRGKFVGALGDIGGFSLNYHKHIHTGEGGLLVTNDNDLAQRCQMIRNHGENVIDAFGVTDLSNVIGANYRLTEIQAAMGTVQMDNVEEYVNHRNHLARHLSKRLSAIAGFKPPVIKNDCVHSFYVYAVKYDESAHGISREVMANAIKAEMPTPTHWEQDPLAAGYTKPLYLNQIYQKKIALGSKGFPWNQNPDVKYDYSKGICPTAERMHFKELLYSPLVREAVTIDDLNDFADSIEKVIENKAELQGLERS
jgi:perosamine synthetase